MIKIEFELHKKFLITLNLFHHKHSSYLNFQKKYDID